MRSKRWCIAARHGRSTTYYLELVGVSQFAGMTGAGGASFIVGSGLRSVPLEYIEPKLEACKFQPPRATEH